MEVVLEAFIAGGEIENGYSEADSERWCELGAVDGDGGVEQTGDGGEFGTGCVGQRDIMGRVEQRARECEQVDKSVADEHAGRRTPGLHPSIYQQRQSSLCL